MDREILLYCFTHLKTLQFTFDIKSHNVNIEVSFHITIKQDIVKSFQQWLAQNAISIELIDVWINLAKNLNRDEKCH